MSARRQRPPWYNCSKLGCVSFEARRQRESCRSTDAPSGISLSTALEDCGPASCVRKTADSLEPPRYRCKGNVLLMTWPSYCFQEKLIIAPQVGEFLRSEEHTSELQSRLHLVCRLLLEKKKKINNTL